METISNKLSEKLEKSKTVLECENILSFYKMQYEKEGKLDEFLTYFVEEFYKIKDPLTRLVALQKFDLLPKEEQIAMLACETGKNFILLEYLKPEFKQKVISFLEKKLRHGKKYKLLCYNEDKITYEAA